MTGIALGFAMVGCSNNTKQLDAFRTENEELRAQYTDSQEALQAADSDLQLALDELRTEQERNGTLRTVNLSLAVRPKVEDNPNKRHGVGWGRIRKMLTDMAS